MAAGTVSRTTHFALHRSPLAVPDAALDAAQAPLCLPAEVWLGALIPKRWAKRSVTRNAIKRQIYAVSALDESRLPVAAHVVRLRTSFDRKQFVSATSDALKAAVRGELAQLFERAALPRPSVRSAA